MEIREEKIALRREMKRRLAARNQAADAVQSRLAAANAVERRLAELSPLADARSLMIYLSTPSEFPTETLLAPLFTGTKNGPREIVVPCCDGNEIELFLLLSPQFNIFSKNGEKLSKTTICAKQANSYGELLASGAFGILEPKLEYRNRPERRYSPEKIDLVLVPGLAFDRFGGRLGRGKGFYDRFFQKLPQKTVLVGLAFDEQLVERVPVEPHDRKMDFLLTPENVLSFARSFPRTS